MAEQGDHQAHDRTGDARARILTVAARLLAEGGENAATTRAVAEAANTQVPAIYRLFGDKNGMLDAVAERAYERFVAEKSGRKILADPLEDLVRGWDDYIAFGLANPAVFHLSVSVYPSAPSKAAVAGRAVLSEKVARVAQSGRLRVSEDSAVDLIQSSATGCILSLLAKPSDQRNDLASQTRNAIFSHILNDQPGIETGAFSGLAIALKARLGETTALSPGERLLLNELLERLCASGEDIRPTQSLTGE